MSFDPPGPINEARDAGSLVIVDRSGSAPRLLLGKRHERQAFVPGKFVFPGGGVDAGDHLANAADELGAAELERLLHDMKGIPSPVRARAIAMAALRETFEETGLLIGRPCKPGTPGPDTWAPFLAHDHLPRLDGIRFITRAITPPGRTRRYDARFFYVPASHIAMRSESRDGEFTELRWTTFPEALALDLHDVTRAVVAHCRELGERADQPCERLPVPYYYGSDDEWIMDSIP